MTNYALLTLHEKSDDDVGLLSVVDQASVLAGVAGAQALDGQTELGVQSDSGFAVGVGKAGDLGFFGAGLRRHLGHDRLGRGRIGVAAPADPCEATDEAVFGEAAAGEAGILAGLAVDGLRGDIGDVQEARHRRFCVA